MLRRPDARVVGLGRIKGWDGLQKVTGMSQSPVRSGRSPVGRLEPRTAGTQPQGVGGTN